MNDFDDVQRLIRLKRYETPGEEFYQSFSERLKERQRSEMLRHSARGLLAERVSTWLEDFGGARRLVPAGALAAAAVGVGLYYAQGWRVPGDDIPAAASLAERPAQAETRSAPLDEGEVLQLKLPKITAPIPGAGSGPYEGGAIVPAGVRSGLREL